jgi:hypothetical protein
MCSYPDEFARNQEYNIIKDSHNVSGIFPKEKVLYY